MRLLQPAKVPLSLVATVIIVGPEAKLLPSHHTTKMDGKNWMIFNQHDMDTEQSSMVIKSLSSEDLEQSKLNLFEISKSYSQYFRYTEIWSDKNGTKNIQLAEPQLDNYYIYPELFLVNIDFCVKP